MSIESQNKLCCNANAIIYAQIQASYALLQFMVYRIIYTFLLLFFVISHVYVLYVLVFLYFDKRQRRLRSEKAVLLQRIYRGHLGRCRASRRREELKLYLSLAPFAIRIQRNVRGYLCRIVHTKSSRLIREMYFNRKKEVCRIFYHTRFRC